MNSAEIMSYFSNWLVSTKKLSEGTAKHYVRGIKDAGRYNLNGDGNLLSPDAETVKGINLILSNTTFINDDKIKHQNMSCALKQYAEYLTSSHRKELFEKNKKNPEVPVMTQEKRERVQLNIESKIPPQKSSLQPIKIEPFLLDQFAKIEQEQRKIVLESYDIENEEESIKTEQVASSNIRKIRQWKADMTRIFDEMADSGFAFEVTPSGFKSDIPQRPTPECPTVESPAPTTSQAEGLITGEGEDALQTETPPIKETQVPSSPVNMAEAGKTQTTPQNVDEYVSVKTEVVSPFVESLASEEIQVKPPSVEVPVVQKPQIIPPPEGVSAVEKSQVTPPPVGLPVAEKSQVVPSPVQIPVIEESQVIPQTAEVPVEDSPEADLSPLKTNHIEPLKEEKSSVLPQIIPSGIITEMCLLGQNYAYSTPIEFFIKVCEMMVLHRPYAVGTFCDNKSLNLENQVNFSYQESDLNNQGIRLNNGLWVNKNQEESRIVALCYNVVKTCGFEESDLQLKLKGG